MAAERRAEEQEKKRSDGGRWAVVLNRKTGYNLTTVHHRPLKKLASTSSMSPSKAVGSSQAGGLRSNNYYPLPDNCWVCRDVKSTCIRGM